MKKSVLSALLRRMTLLLTAGLALLPAAPSRAQIDQEVLLHEPSGTVVKIRHVFSEVPPSGATALQVTLVNRRNEPLEVTLSATAGMDNYYGGNFMEGGALVLSAQASSTVTQEWTAPLSMTGWGNWQSLQISINSPLRTSGVTFSSQLMAGHPFVAFSTGLTSRSLRALQEEMVRRRTAAWAAASTSGSGYTPRTAEGKFAAGFDPVNLPSDWRALSGLDALALSADEWLRLPEAVRLAVRRYVLAGGWLDLYAGGPAPAGLSQEFGLPPGEPGVSAPVRAGAGTLRVLPWDGKELEAAALSAYEEGAGLPVRVNETGQALLRREILKPGEKRLPNLQDLLGSRSFAAWQVGVILLMFGIIVGPVNLFYLAGQGRRHRLFFTTPLISLGASAVLVAVIFLQDGTGGDGRRAALVYLPEGENAAYAKQYQVSRTGVLFSGGFTLPESTLITPLVLPESRWTRLKETGGGRSASQRFTAAASGECGGDWFQSRSEQGQLLEAVQPFRGRLEKRAAPGPDGAPVLVSRFGFRLEALYFQDAAGKWWTAPGPVESGAETALQPAPQEAVNAWLEEALSVFPPPDRQRLKSALRPGNFLASASGPAAGLIPTLTSIRWTDDRALLHGPVPPMP